MFGSITSHSNMILKLVKFPPFLPTQIWSSNAIFKQVGISPFSLFIMVLKYDPQVPSSSRLESLHYFLLKYDAQIDLDSSLLPTQLWSSNRLGSLHYFLIKYDLQIDWALSITFYLNCSSNRLGFLNYFWLKYDH